MKVLNVAALALAFGLLDYAAPTVILTTTSLSLAALANGAVAVGAVVLGASLLAGLLGRSKRQASECLSFSDPDLLFNLAVNSDTLGCSQRFVCEIAARDIETLSDQEKIIRSVFININATTQADSGKNILRNAAQLGSENEIVMCAATYNKCPFDSKTLLQEFLKTTKQQ